VEGPLPAPARLGAAAVPHVNRKDGCPMNSVLRFVHRLTCVASEALLCFFWACVALALLWWVALTIQLVRGSS